MSYTVVQESLDNFASCWSRPARRLEWNLPFTLPAWLKVWWQELGCGVKLYLLSVRQQEEIIGIAPLLAGEQRASFIGSADVCDYLDFVVVPGEEKNFFDTLLDHLREKGIGHLGLGPLRPESTVLTHLAGIARNRGYKVICQPEDVSLELELPSTWEEYLTALDRKQRHELRRKLRRLSEAGKVDYLSVKDRAGIDNAMDIFLKMFAESRQDKASFLTDQMESFFRSLADSMAQVGLLRLDMLELDAVPMAMVMCFDYNDCVYLYNSGYDPRYNSLSAGLLCKALCIQKSIQEGRKRFDFLKGDEAYKYHLGGREVLLSNCQITMRQ